MTPERWKEAWDRLPGATGFTRTRAEGLSAFERAGIPTPRHEDWKYTSLAPLRDAVFTSVGSLSWSHEGPEGALTCREIREEDVHPLPRDAEDAFSALNRAFSGAGLVVEVPAGAQGGVLRVTHHAADGQSAHPRVVVRVGAGARVTIVERYTGDGRHLHNPVTQLHLDPGAQAELIRAVPDAPHGFHLGRVVAEVGEGAALALRSFAYGGRIARIRLDVTLGEAARVDMDGLFLAGKGALVDHHTFVDHPAPSAVTRERFKGVIDGGGRGVFTGKVRVGAQSMKTDAAQHVRSLLLADDATANARPQLEINADDVKCSHGAAVGRLDDEALFFLRARGLDLADARRLLIHGFAAGMLTDVGDDAIRDVLEADLRDWLARVGAQESA